MNSSSKFVKDIRGAIKGLGARSAHLDAILNKEYVTIDLIAQGVERSASHQIASVFGVPQTHYGQVRLSYHQFARLACALDGLDLDDLIVRASQAGSTPAASPEVVAEKKPSPPKADPQAVQALMTLPGREVSKEIAEQIASGWPSGLDFNAYMQMALDRHTSTAGK